MILGERFCMRVDCEECPLNGLRCAWHERRYTTDLTRNLYELLEQWRKDFDIEENDPIYLAIKKRLNKKVEHEKEN